MRIRRKYMDGFGKKAGDGHKNVLSTQIYINMEQALFSGNSNEYHVKAVSTVDEAMKLVEVGFEYVTEIDGMKLFRKRK